MARKHQKEKVSRTLAYAELFGVDRAVENCNVTADEISQWQREQLAKPDAAIADRKAYWRAQLSDPGEVAATARLVTLVMLQELRDRIAAPDPDTFADDIDALSKAAERTHKIARSSNEDAEVAPLTRLVLDRAMQEQCPEPPSSNSSGK